jgi:hypothetical protein
MDWRKIERDVKIQTSGLMQNSLQYPPDRSSIPYEEHQSFRSNVSDSFGTRPSHNSSFRLNPTEIPSQYDLQYQVQPKIDILQGDITELREIIYKQNEKIRSLDHFIENTLSIQSRYDSLAQRFQSLEHEQQTTVKYLTTLSREQSEYLVQTKNVSGKIEWLEELVRSVSQDSVTKSAFSQFLESCSEQLKLVHVSTEQAKNNSSLCMSFLDSFLAALSQLQHTSSTTPTLSGSSSNHAPSGGFVMGLEYLTSLGSSSGG